MLPGFLVFLSIPISNLKVPVRLHASSGDRSPLRLPTILWQQGQMNAFCDTSLSTDLSEQPPDSMSVGVWENQTTLAGWRMEDFVPLLLRSVSSHQLQQESSIINGVQLVFFLIYQTATGRWHRRAWAIDLRGVTSLRHMKESGAEGGSEIANHWSHTELD